MRNMKKKLNSIQEDQKGAVDFEGMIVPFGKRVELRPVAQKKKGAVDLVGMIILMTACVLFVLISVNIPSVHDWIEHTVTSCWDSIITTLSER